MKLTKSEEWIISYLKGYQIEVQFICYSIDVFVGQRVFPTRIAEYGREIIGDMLPCPKQRRKAVLTT